MTTVGVQVHVHEGRTPRFDRWVLPRIDGGYLWSTLCLICHQRWAGTSQRQDAVLPDSAVMAPPGTGFITYEDLRGIRNGERPKVRARLGNLQPVLGYMCERSHKLAEPGKGRVVAVDGSRSAAGVLGWGVVTGAGWKASGTSAYTGEASTAEALAVIEALRLFDPIGMHGEPLTIRTDNLLVATAMRDVMRGRRVAKGLTRHLPDALARDFGSLLTGRVDGGYPVRVLWVRRNTSQLHKAADRLARAAATAAHAGPSATPQ